MRPRWERSACVAGASRIPAHVEPATASLFIVSPLAGGASAIFKWFSTHPPMAERIARLRALNTGRGIAAGGAAGSRFRTAG